MKALSRTKRIRRHARIRSRMNGTVEVPRLSVFRSGKHLFVQLIDDKAGKTLLALSDKKVGVSEAKDGAKKVAVAFSLGKQIGTSAKAKGISRVVFDRSGYAYHGRVRAVAEGAREGGLQI